MATNSVRLESSYAFPQWEKRFGGDFTDTFVNVWETADGGYMLGGSLGLGPYPAPPRDFWFVRLDQDGNRLWEKSFGDGYSDATIKFEKTADGGFVLLGSESPGSFSAPQLLLLRLTANGDRLWQKSFTAADPPSACVREAPDGGFILAFHVLISLEFKQRVLRLDQNGNILWDKFFNGVGGPDYPKDVQLAPGGGFILASASGSDVGGERSSRNMGMNDIWLIRLDDAGNKLWDKTYGGSDLDGVSVIQRTSEGGFIVGGWSASGISGNKTSPSLGGTDYWVLRLDANGNVVWDKTFGGSGNDDLSTVQQTGDGGFILGGEAQSGMSGNKSSPATQVYWLVRLDANGNKLWDQSFQPDGAFYALNSVIQTGDGGFVLATSSGADQRNYDGWAIKLHERMVPAGSPWIYMNDQPAVTNDYSLTAGTAVRLKLTTTFSQGKIYYTLDGSLPTQASARYTNEFILKQSAVLRAVAYTAGLSGSAQAQPIALRIGVTDPGFGITLFEPQVLGGTFNVSIQTRSGGIYVLESKDSLKNAAWTFRQRLSGNGQGVTFNDSNAGAASRFYRVRLE